WTVTMSVRFPDKAIASLSHGLRCCLHARTIIALHRRFSNRKIKASFDIFRLLERVESREPFAYFRFSDGEFLMLNPPGRDIPTQDRCVIPAGTSKLRTELYRIFSAKDRPAYFAIPVRPTLVFPPKSVKWYFDHTGQSDAFLTSIE